MDRINSPRFLHLISFTFLLLIFLIGSGCGEQTPPEPARIEIRAGDGQAGAPGTVAEKPLQIEVLGEIKPGILGGKGRRLPVPDIKIRFELLNEESSMEIIGAKEVSTDAGGLAGIKIRFGNEIGDQYLKAEVIDHPELSTDFRLISGIEKKGDRQEVFAGNELPEPLGLKVFNDDGTPAENIPVYFHLVNQPDKGARLTQTKSITDESGIATTNLITSSGTTGKYEIIAETSCPEKDIHIRSMNFTAMSLAIWQVVLGVLGGLGIFIFGMKTMSESLRQVAGAKLRSFLHFFTSNRFSAIAAGTTITALIQSSSATTVMVVGFVNAGLITLQQSIGVIFGANIGTTVTAQMISLNIKELALPAIALGVTGVMFSRRNRTRNIFEALLGFGLIFLGMEMMSSQLSDISSLPSFVEIFHAFDCSPTPDGVMPLGPVLGAIAIGTAMTVLVQSSSATIGLTIALAASGLLNFYTAVPLILGDNIGTTITAVLASLGANRRARQAAIGHSLFNLLGACYMILLFYVRIDNTPIFLYLVNMVTAGNVFASVPENIARHVAGAHTLFNVFNVLIFIPLIPLITKLCNFILPVKEQEEPAELPLEPHLLETPSFALQQSIVAMRRMTETAWNLVEETVEAFKEGNSKLQDSLMQQEHSIDEMQRKTIKYLTDLTRHPLSEAQAEVIPLIIHCVNDAERIGDHGVNIMELTDQVNEEKLKISENAIEEISRLTDSLRKETETVVLALHSKNNQREINKALTLEGEIHERIRNAEKYHLKRLEKQECTVSSGILYTELLGNLERVADHLSNIAERAAEITRKPWED